MFDNRVCKVDPSGGASRSVTSSSSTPIHFASNTRTAEVGDGSSEDSRLNSSFKELSCCCRSSTVFVKAVIEARHCGGAGLGGVLRGEEGEGNAGDLVLVVERSKLGIGREVGQLVGVGKVAAGPREIRSGEGALKTVWDILDLGAGSAAEISRATSGCALRSPSSGASSAKISAFAACIELGHSRNDRMYI